MNRLQLWPHASPLAAPNRQQDEPALLTTTDCSEAAYRVFVPLHYEPNYAYPLLIWLHSPGGDECELPRIMPMVSLRNYVAVGPRGNGSCRVGYLWDDSPRSLAAAERTVFECIERTSQQFHIHAQRIFIGGYASGGTTAVRLGLRHPQRFAGALSVGGPFPEGATPLAGLNEARKLPLFVAQGRDSLEYSTERTCEELRLFHAAGMNVTLRQYPCGDELTTQMLHDVDVWVMEQVTGISSSPSESASPSSEADHWN